MFALRSTTKKQQ